MENTIPPSPQDSTVATLPSNTEGLAPMRSEKEILETLDYYIKENIDVFIRLRDK